MAQPVHSASLPFVAARWFHSPRSASVIWIVIHTMEAPQSPHTARNCAQDFHTTSRKASAHYCVDEAEIYHCVQEGDVAYAAPPANNRGIHIEHAGFAAFSGAEWGQGPQVAMLALSAQLAADVLHRHDVPIDWLSPADLIAGRHGFTSHANVTAAWHQSTHTDPGHFFPSGHYLDLVRAALV